VDYRIGMLWIGGPLSWTEQMCIKSYLRVGYEVDLYHYDEVYNVPEGVNLLDAREILSGDCIYRYFLNGSPAIHADKFRYRLLRAREDIIWSDTDVYCLRPYEPRNGYFLAWGTKNMVFISVLKLPVDSPALHDIINFTEEDHPVPPWLSKGAKKYLQIRKALGWPAHVTKLQWTVWGSRSLTYFMQQHGEVKYVMEEHSLYPIPANRKEDMLSGRCRLQDFRMDREVYCIHLYTGWLKDRLAREKDLGKFSDTLLMDMVKEQGVEVDLNFRPASNMPEFVRKIRRKLKV